MRQTHTNILYAIQTPCVTVKLRVRAKNGPDDRCRFVSSPGREPVNARLLTIGLALGTILSLPAMAQTQAGCAKTAQAETPRPQMAQAETPRPQMAQAETPRPQMAQAEATRPQMAQAEAARPQMAQAEAGRPQMAQAEAGRPQLAQAEARGAPQQVAGIAAPCK